MHRLILTSNTYRQSSQVVASQQELDPANRCWSRFGMRRMSAEELRDTLLWVAGRLDETRFGPGEPVTIRPDGLVLSGQRRSIYGQQLRKSPPSLLESFDLPAMNPNCLQRTDSLVAPQALHLLNDSSVRQLARQFAERIVRISGDPARQIEQAYWLALSRPPTGEEVEWSRRALRGLEEVNVAAGSGDDGSPATAVRTKALGVICHTLMNSAAFLYID